MGRLLAIGLVRIVHAWAWTVLWLIILERSVLEYRIDVLLAAALGVVLTPLIYLPLLAWREQEDDGMGAWSVRWDGGAVGAFVACVCMSGLILALLNFLAHWDKRGPGSAAAMMTAVLLHGLTTASIALSERWLGLRNDADD